MTSPRTPAGRMTESASGRRGRAGVLSIATSLPLPRIVTRARGCASTRGAAAAVSAGSASVIAPTTAKRISQRFPRSLIPQRRLAAPFPATPLGGGPREHPLEEDFGRLASSRSPAGPPRHQNAQAGPVRPGPNGRESMVSVRRIFGDRGGRGGALRLSRSRRVSSLEDVPDGPGGRRDPGLHLARNDDGRSERQRRGRDRRRGSARRGFGRFPTLARRMIAEIRQKNGEAGPLSRPHALAPGPHGRRPGVAAPRFRG